MLKTTDFIRTFPISNRTDRDAEIPLLLEFLKRIQFESLLDVGAHYSNHKGYSYYAPEVRKLVKRYDGIDILDDLEAKQLLDNYYIGNAVDYPLGRYDVVICVSTIEHSGISTYKKENPYKERDDLFLKCLDLAKRYMWISFPVGQEYTYPNELSIITDQQLTFWEHWTKDFRVKERFVYTQGSQAGHPWYEHTKREVALRIPYIDYVGNSSICVMEIDKNWFPNAKDDITGESVLVNVE